MITHVVFFKVKNQKDRAKLIEELRSLPDKIDCIVEYEVGDNISTSDKSADVCLYSKFADENKLNEYRNHPEHKKILDFILGAVDEIRVVDYEV